MSVPVDPAQLAVVEEALGGGGAGLTVLHHLKERGMWMWLGMRDASFEIVQYVFNVKCCVQLKPLFKEGCRRIRRHITYGRA